MVMCICASPRRGLSLARRKLEARLGDEGLSECLAATLCQLGPGVGLSLPSSRCLTGLMVQLFEVPGEQSSAPSNAFQPMCPFPG